MAEYTIPKPYRDFYVTDPYVGLQKEVEDLQKYSNPFSAVEYGSVLHGENTLPDKEIPAKVESKNLLPFPYANGATKTINGLTFTVGDDGGITVNGTPTGIAEYTIADHMPIDKTKTYIFSLSGTFTNIVLYVGLFDSDGNHIQTFQSNTPVLLEGLKYPSLYSVTFNIKRSDNVETSGTVYPMLEKGDTATSYALYQPEGTPVTVTTCGKNLLNVPSTYTLTGYTAPYIPLFMVKNQTYTISVDSIETNGDDKPYLFFYQSDFKGNHEYVASQTLASNQTYAITPTKDITHVAIYSNGITAESTKDITATFSNLMIQVGHKKTSYESYNSVAINTKIGEKISINQLNDYTNIHANKLWFSLSSRFVLYNEELFHDKLTAIIGTFANRPTDITDYDRLYIATDKTDTSRSTILPAGKSGATASNWIYI